MVDIKINNNCGTVIGNDKGQVIIDGKKINAKKNSHIIINGDVGSVDAISVEVHGNVNGDIDATNVCVKGKINGDIDAINVYRE